MGLKTSVIVYSRMIWDEVTHQIYLWGNVCFIKDMLGKSEDTLLQPLGENLLREDSIRALE